MPNWKNNSYIAATLITIIFVIILAFVNYLRGNELGIPSIAGGAVVFWVVFFLADRYFKKRLGKKKS